MRPPHLDEEEVLMALDDTLTMCAAGRVDGHRCPFCPDVELACALEEGWVKVQCPSCGLKFEGLAG